ncbi:hypothetical protein SEA_TYPHA_37 [Mycobacterium phage Typha]|uniref:Uncharacterized protein n=1 Tax=Mycobacterium phage Typha TaxID=2517971 RepID=A0A482JAH3_9CAUD|nr:hypothetical protein KCH40_gp037 [Mycobacterium phage Typha]QBP29694.1 hypothetical protein SEA_TYPHA_37 [Mycobacterium phage Typha]URM86481.1 hypothetical protein PBI_HILLTOPFARM_37 [Mycobacterium phage Hilltopfarm]
MTTTPQPLTSEQRDKPTPQVRKRHLKALAKARANQIKAQDEVRQLIIDGFALGISGQDLADAAGVSKPRVYQIRDGR